MPDAPQRQRLHEALSAWEAACRALEARSQDESLTEEEQETENNLHAAAWAILGQVRSLQQQLAALAPHALEALEALEAINEREALREERSARHGELAGVAFRHRERASRLEAARDGIEGAAANLEEALASLDD